MPRYQWSGGSPCEGALTRSFRRIPTTSLTMRRLVDGVSALAIGSAVLVASQAAQSHGIAGNRFFPGTLTFDDPAVADEAIAPTFLSAKRAGEGGDMVDNRINWSF